MVNGISPNSIFSKIKEEAKEYVEKTAEMADSKYTSDGEIIFLSEGISKFRLYLDEKEGTFSRSVWRHMVGKSRLLCMGEGCPLCAAVKEIKAMGYKFAFEFRSKEIAMSYGCIIQADWLESEKKKFIGQPLLLMYDWKVKREIATKFSELDIATLEQLFNPEIEMPIFELHYKGGQGGNVSLGFDLRKSKIPKLPAEVKPLSQRYIPVNAFPNDEEVTKAKAYMYKTAQEALAKTLVNPAVTSSGIVNPTADPIPPANPEVTPKKECFGKYDPTPNCVLCKDEASCKKSSVPATT